MPKNSLLPQPETLPAIGYSRLRQFQKFLPFSRETFRKLVRDGRAPQPKRMGIRCSMFSNSELHKFLADPSIYKAGDLK